MATNVSRLVGAPKPEWMASVTRRSTVISSAGTILGLSHSHDSGIALLRDGILVAAVNEERLSRRKHDGSFPARSLAWLLNEVGVEAGEIDAVAVAGRHLASYPSLNNDLSEDDGSYRAPV